VKPRCSRPRQIGFIIAFCLVITGGASSNDRNFVISIYTNNLGPVTPEGRRLYAVVAKDGEMTYADSADNGIVNRKRALNTTEFSKLKELLKNQPLSALKGARLGRSGAHVDYVTRVEVSIVRDSEPQEFSLVLYDPSTGHDFPAGAKELLCFIDEIRGSTYRLSGDCK
jgi:hypothetical protein